MPTLLSVVLTPLAGIEVGHLLIMFWSMVADNEYVEEHCAICIASAQAKLDIWMLRLPLGIQLHLQSLEETWKQAKQSGRRTDP